MAFAEAQERSLPAIRDRAVGVRRFGSLAIANVPRAIHHGRPFDEFLSSAAAIAAFTFLFGAALFPDLITSSKGAAYSLTESRAASSEKTLEIMQVVAALELPFVLAFTATIYWVFHGKVRVTPASY
jgi:cytochrome d ubiquinol oxidase subunit II